MNAPRETLCAAGALSAVVLVPIRIESVANLREHYHARARRAREHLSATWYALRAAKAPHSVPCTVTITRVAPRKLDDDNAISGMKACRDGVALWLGVDDGDERITWRYAQRQGGVREYAAEVRIDVQP